MQIKQISIALIATLSTITSFAQDRKDLTVSVGVGKMSSPYYLNADAGEFFSIDLGYQLSKRQTLSANYNAGRHNYYDNVLSNISEPFKESTTNSKVSYNTFSIIYKYKVLDKKIFSVNIGAGAGLMTETRQYPYTEGNSSNFRETSITGDIVFPVVLEFDFKLSEHFKLGLAGGFFVEPDYPIVNFYAGPRFSYVIK